MARRELRDSRVVITGASSGIGRELAIKLAEAGAKLILVARRQDRLDELIQRLAPLTSRVSSVVGDVTDAKVRERVITEVRDHFQGLDILVNNAGIGALGPFAAANENRLRRIMEVNFFALAELTRAAVPLLQMGRKPMVVNVSSVLGHRAIPYCSEYCASKFAVQGLSEALRAEFTNLGIDVLVVSPGTTRTEFFENVLERHREPAGPFPGASAAWVAERTVKAIRRGSHEIVPSSSGRLLVWMNRAAPWLVDRLLARWA